MGNGMCCPCRDRIRNANRKITLLLVGLDNAGKTTGAKRLAGESLDNVLSTVGFSSIKLKYKGHPVTIYDVGGGPQIRNIWTRYYNDAHGLIFMVDASDIFRLKEAKRLFENVLKNEKIAGKPVLVLVNKQDREGALDDIDIVERWDLERLVNDQRCPTLVRVCTATVPIDNDQAVDNGLFDGYTWLVTQVLKMYDSLNRRVEYDVRVEEARVAEERAAWKLKKGQLNEAYDDDHPNDSISPFQPIGEVITHLEGKQQNGYHKPSSEVFTIYNGANNMPVGVMHEESHSNNARKKSGGGLLRRRNEVVPIEGLSSGLVPLVSSPSTDLLPNLRVSSFQAPLHRLPPIQHQQRPRPTSSRSLGDEGVWGLHESLEVIYPPKNIRSSSNISS